MTEFATQFKTSNATEQDGKMLMSMLDKRGPLGIGIQNALTQAEKVSSALSNYLASLDMIETWVKETNLLIETFQPGGDRVANSQLKEKIVGKERVIVDAIRMLEGKILNLLKASAASFITLSMDLFAPLTIPEEENFRSRSQDIDVLDVSLETLRPSFESAGSAGSVTAHVTAMERTESRKHDEVSLDARQHEPPNPQGNGRRDILISDSLQFMDSEEPSPTEMKQSQAARSVLETQSLYITARNAVPSTNRSPSAQSNLVAPTPPSSDPKLTSNPPPRLQVRVNAAPVLAYNPLDSSQGSATSEVATPVTETPSTATRQPEIPTVPPRNERAQVLRAASTEVNPEPTNTRPPVTVVDLRRIDFHALSPSQLRQLRGHTPMTRAPLSDTLRFFLPHFV